MSALLADVVVNGTVIAAARIAAEAQMHPAPQGKPGFAWTAAARALVLRELMLQEARRAGLVPAPAEIAPDQRETPDEALIRQLMDLRLHPAPVEEAVLQARYDADPARFRAPPLWEVSHILFAAGAADRGAVRARAAAALAGVLARPDRFADFAAQSDCPSRSAGGRLGQIGPGETLAEFEAALASLSPGQIAPRPVETRFGFHILRLDARAEGAVLPFAGVRTRLREAAEKAAWARAARDFAESLLAEARIEGLSLGGAGIRPAGSDA